MADINKGKIDRGEKDAKLQKLKSFKKGNTLCPRQNVYAYSINIKAFLLGHGLGYKWYRNGIEIVELLFL